MKDLYYEKSSLFTKRRITRQDIYTLSEFSELKPRVIWYRFVRTPIVSREIKNSLGKLKTFLERKSEIEAR